MIEAFCQPCMTSSECEACQVAERGPGGPLGSEAPSANPPGAPRPPKRRGNFIWSSDINISWYNQTTTAVEEWLQHEPRPAQQATSPPVLTPLCLRASPSPSPSRSPSLAPRRHATHDDDAWADPKPRTRTPHHVDDADVHTRAATGPTVGGVTDWGIHQILYIRRSTSREE